MDASSSSSPSPTAACCCRAGAPIPLRRSKSGLAGDTLSCFQAEAATFARADVSAPAAGLMLALPPDAAASLAGLGAVFLLSADRLYRSTLHEHRLLDPSDSIGHIRAMQSMLSCSEFDA